MPRIVCRESTFAVMVPTYASPRFSSIPSASSVPSRCTEPNGPPLRSATYSLEIETRTAPDAGVGGGRTGPGVGDDPVAAPAHTTRSTHAPSATLVPATGLWLITCPAGTQGLAVTAPTASLAFASVLVAATCV